MGVREHILKLMIFLLVEFQFFFFFFFFWGGGQRPATLFYCVEWKGGNLVLVTNRKKDRIRRANARKYISNIPTNI